MQGYNIMTTNNDKRSRSEYDANKSEFTFHTNKPAKLYNFYKNQKTNSILSKITVVQGIYMMIGLDLLIILIKHL